MEFKQSNFDLLRIREEVNDERLASVEINEGFQVEETKSGAEIMVLQKEGRAWRLNSRIDPLEAAEVYAKRYTIRPFGTYFIFGLSDGRHLREILKKCDKTNHIIICEPNAGGLKFICENFDLTDIIADKRVRIYSKEVTDSIDSIMNRYLEYTDLKIIEFCILPGYDMLFPKECEAFMDAVIDRIENDMVQKSTRINFSRMIPQHTFYNMKRMISARNIEQIRDAISSVQINEIPAIIVSAGPSLDKNIKDLKAAEGKAMIIVVDAALRTVLKAGIHPDIVCTIDPESPDRFFEELNLDDIAWCCNRISRPWILEHCGKKIYYYGFFDRDWDDIVNNVMGKEFPDMPSGGSVTATAFVLACYLGFRKLVLIGQDMAFTGGVSHTKGIDGAFGDNEEYIKSRCLMQVEGIDGELLQTDYQMWFYKKWFEKNIRVNEKELDVIDATEGGARIEGTRIMRLSDAISEECAERFSFEEYECTITNAFSEEQRKKLYGVLAQIEPKTLELREKIKTTIQLQDRILYVLREEGRSADQVLNELKQMMECNEKLEEMQWFQIMASYAQKEEYELGDEIYTEEELSIEELVERNRALYFGYENAVNTMLEDIKECIK